MIHQWRFNMRKSWLNQSYFWFYHTHKIFHTSTLSPYYSGKFWNFLMKIEKHTWLTIGNTTVLKPSAIFISNLSFVTGYPPYIESPKKVCQMKNLKNKSLQRTWLTLLFVRKKKLLWQGAHDIFLSTCCIPRRCPDHMFKSTQRVAFYALERRLYPARAVSYFCLKIVTLVPIYFVFVWNNYTFWIRFCLISYYKTKNDYWLKDLHQSHYTVGTHKESLCVYAPITSIPMLNTSILIERGLIPNSQSITMPHFAKHYINRSSSDNKIHSYASNYEVKCERPSLHRC